jgi:HD-GYP domain-containing protein (c-di-GMP phosphodiesterase class II)
MTTAPISTACWSPGSPRSLPRLCDFAKTDQQHLVRGVLLHDLGKAKIPFAILNKPGALTGEEIAVMRTHARIGHELLRGQGEYEPELLEVVLSHHKLLDGSGYPDGLASPQINDLVRLVTICDIYAALIERRPYRQLIEPAQAFKIVQEMEGKLEGALVRAFAQVAQKSAMSISRDRRGLAQIGPTVLRPVGPSTIKTQERSIDLCLGHKRIRTAR